MSKRPANTHEKAHLWRIKQMDCIACGQSAPSEAHHITDCGRRLGHYFTLPLCPGCHRGSNGFSGINREAWDKSLTSQLKLCVQAHGELWRRG